MASGGTLPVRTGAYNATGAALDLFGVGFTPKLILFFNLTTGATAEWSDSMEDDSVVTHDSGTDAVATSGGVTPDDAGFSIGTNAVINTADDRVHYTAIA